MHYQSIYFRAGYDQQPRIYKRLLSSQSILFFSSYSALGSSGAVWKRLQQMKPEIPLGT